MVVGNKGDIKGTEEGASGEKREVTREEVEEWVSEEGLAGYVECSAKNGEGVEEVSDIEYAHHEWKLIGACDLIRLGFQYDHEDGS